MAKKKPAADTPDDDPVARHLADPADAEARDEAADYVRLRGSVTSGGKTYRYDPATGSVVEAETTADEPEPEPEPDDA